MIWLLLVAVLFKSLLWWLVVPVFQTPDEQAHFVQLQWYVEKRSLNVGIESKDLSLEVAVAEEILGTRRDAAGNNKYTYHPEYKNNSIIPAMPISYRTIYVDREAAGYPPLYYLLALPFYNAVYDAPLTDRIMATRFLSVILSLGLATVAYKIGKIIWDKEGPALALAVIVSFQPMVSFVLSGFHPDNLLNLLASAMILVCLLVIKNGVKWKYLIALGFLAIAAWETKPTIIFLLPVVAAIVAWRSLGWPVAGAILLAPVVAFALRIPLPYMPFVGPQSPLIRMNFADYLQFRLPKIAFEMWPWFWGVFKWLGVTLPPLVMKVITRVAILAGVSLAIKIAQDLRKKPTLEFKFIALSILTLTSYLLYLVLWDWRLMQSIGYSQGLQGRYLFPVIVPAMALLLIGSKLWHEKLVYLLAGGMIVLNGVALVTVYGSY